MRRLGVLLTPALAVLLSLPPAPSTAVPGEADATAQGPNPFRDGWHESVLDADQNFRGLEAVSRTEAWVTGESLTDGGVARVFRTTDRGRTWADVSPADSAGLSFRDVEVHGKVAHVLAIGPGEASRIYRSTDGGATWTEAFRNTDEKAFYDCMAFYGNGRRGLAVSDPVEGKLRILSTDDRGRSWSVLPSRGMPATADEFGFAASGDCLVTSGTSAFIITGGAKSRVLRSDDRGLTWKATASGIPAGESAGGFAGAFASPRHGIVVGGDFADAGNTEDTTAYTRDGRTWTSGGDLRHVGEDVTVLRGWRYALATGDYDGSAGTSLTSDGGRTWTRVSKKGYHVIDCVATTCWAAGSTGRVGRG
ncbi:oxidoreductase [Nocardioides hwasunensis]|uniref:Oxidoreductase n=1 Tax=Nocardioides hwasunensis TaxID=397258 RepID=A0ABR8MKX8_9ACTN|nr:oxidoreductase [Nocardioides hwasunensis]MBD3916240.1 oxidoreductase [Nocardioides hwasunensis]